jgi:DNA processing protein
LHTDNNFYTLALSLIPGIGPVNARSLISYCGSPAQVFKTKKHLLLKIPGIGESTADAIVHHNPFKRAEEEIKFSEQKKITVLNFLDNNYPNRLKQCVDAPLLLFYTGNADLNAEKVLGIVGTRNATDYGRNICEDLIEDLIDLNILIISGLAYGIDIAVHKACVKRNIPNIGVLGHGLDRIYPSVHKDTAKRMIENGGLLTEFLSGSQPDRQNFPRRNRIVAGLIDALVLVETADDGGALITATIADSYNKDVFAYPGNIHNKYSKGCNLLIKTNRAALVENANDILDMLRWKETQIKPKVQRELFIELSDEERLIYDMMKKFEELSIDQLTAQLSITPGTLANALLNLEFQGIVSALPGKRYKLI